MFKPSARIVGELKKTDVWSLINEAAAACTIPVVNLGQGFMNFQVKPFILQAAKDALDQIPMNQYSPTRGRPRLKAAIAKAYSPLLKRTINPETEVLVTAGANEGFYAAFAALLDQGDEVIVMEPFFDQYQSNISFNGGQCKYVALHPPAEGARKSVGAGRWTLDMSELKAAITPKTKMIICNSPHNPIGKIFDIEELKQIGELCVKHNLIILSDEVYDRLDGFHSQSQVRIASLSEELAKRTITVGSAGKTFGCTGWRVGWLIASPELINYCAAAHTRICFVANSPLQEATAVAFERADEHKYFETTRQEYLERLAVLTGIFEELGLPYTIPDGSYFLLVNFSKVKIPADELAKVPEHVTSRGKDFGVCYWLLQNIGVVSVPPTEFYTPAHAHEAEDYLRFAFCKDVDTLKEAGKKLMQLKQYIQ